MSRITPRPWLVDSRKRQGLTQAEVGLIIERSGKAVCTYENGTREMGFQELVKLSDLYGESIHYLVTGERFYAEDQKSPSPELTSSKPTPETFHTAFTDLMSHTSHEERCWAHGYLTALTQEPQDA